MTDQALGHQLVEFTDVPSGVEAHCECGETFWGRWTTAAAKKWAIHSTEEALNRAGDAP